MIFSSSRIFLILSVVLAALLLALALSLLAVSPQRVSRRLWNKHYTVTLQSADRTEELIRRIVSEQRFQGVVSRSSAGQETDGLLFLAE